MLKDNYFRAHVRFLLPCPAMISSETTLRSERASPLALIWVGGYYVLESCKQKETKSRLRTKTTHNEHHRISR